MTTVRTSDPFRAQLQGLRANGVPAPGRREAARRFLRLGLPHRRLEAWRYTNPAPLLRIPWTAASPAAVGRVSPRALPPCPLGPAEAYRFVLVNGHYAPHLSRLPPVGGRVEVTSLRSALAADGPGGELGRTVDLPDAAFLALNTALFADGLCLRAAPGARLDRPLRVLHVAVPAPGAPPAAYPRHFLRLGRGARVTLVEEYVTLAAEGPTFVLPVTEALLAEEAHLEHLRLGREAEDGAFHVGYLLVRQTDGSRFQSLNLALGGGWVRNEVHVRLDGRETHVELLGLTVARGRQHVDHHTRIRHERPAGTSRELFKSILDDEARGVFNGQIYVAPGAQQTDARQGSHALLLSRRAEMDAKPELEIYADDVKCTHGATVGQLDTTALFYLRTRGLGRAEAEALLLWAFAHEVLERLPAGSLRAAAGALLRRRLGRRKRA